MDDKPAGTHVILGTGPLGLALARQLLARGEAVRLVNRSGRLPVTESGTPQAMRADLSDPRAARQACAGATVVYHCLGLPYPQWRQFPALMAKVIEAATQAGARLVYGDNVYAYGAVESPIREGTPETATTVKGRIRAQVAAMLLQAHRDGRVQAAIGRASDFFGPGVTDASMLGTRVFARLLAGKPAQVVGDPQRLHSYTFVEDFARTLVTLGRRDEALGQIWHVPNAPAESTAAIVARIAALTGRPASTSTLPRWLLALAGLFDGNARELREMLYEFEADFVVDATRSETVLGLAATPLEQSLRDTVQWWRRRAAIQV